MVVVNFAQNTGSHLNFRILYEKHHHILIPSKPIKGVKVPPTPQKRIKRTLDTQFYTILIIKKVGGGGTQNKKKPI